MAKSIMLIKVDANQNNNKFYEITLNDSDVVTKRWGRVGQEGTTSTENSGEAGFNRALKAKQKRGYKEVNTVDNVGSETQNKKDLGNLAQQALLSDPSTQNPKVLSLIQRLIETNRHQITASSGGMINIDDNGVLKTPLGIIDQSNIDRAKQLLTTLHTMDPSSKRYVAKLEEYLTLVPQKVAAQRGWHETFLADKNYQYQTEFLDKLASSYDWYQQTLEASKQQENKKKIDHSDLFKYQLNVLQDTSVFDRIEKLFRQNRNVHHHPSAAKFNLKYVYQLENHQDTEDFIEHQTRLGNAQELWHGTSVANILSILSKGLYVPPTSGSTVQITGRMFGNGVYFSNQSTKSLNYSVGFWNRHRQRQGYMFLADVVLGKEYHPKTSGAHASIRNQYDSFYVAPDSAGVLNNEVIVWNTKQIMLKYLCEFSM